MREKRAACIASGDGATGQCPSPNVAEASVCHHKPSHRLDKPVPCLVLQFDVLMKPGCSLPTRGTDLT